MSNIYLLLWFEAPLQSWGFDSKFGRRDTQIFPTKSGVLGLLCSALGAGGEQREFLAEFATLDQTVISFVRGKQTANGVIKQDREPLLRDFHMVGSGYDDQDPWTSLLIPKTSEGKKAVGGGTKMTYRYYLQDAVFAVVLGVPTDKAEAIAQALQNPAWDIYLGRKNCVPTDFIYRGTFDNEAAAIEQAGLIAMEKQRIEDFRVVHGALDDGEADEIFTINDVPVQFGADKRYRDRQVSLIYAR
ncbi:type I-E CRISPR-associated protein Cas5/CasD [Nitrosomonas ureae]|uniref:CRISPR-associated protein, Cas5e family n=1 Tax=Nitrosomonas ureae TaxID=44577 RepID=A0A1H5STM4_9PROT|nr:type I-E CRISPR-associated protein Cas5/CasD [Nitrosomonas ureae]SEF53875.1 CRISPR-associated protein, Cas5e family [Nitrosomonas ureae]